MSSIKELFEIRIKTVKSKREVWLGLITGAIILTLICWWRSKWNALFVAAPIWLFMALLPHFAAKALTGLKVVLAYSFHSLNLLLLSMVYFIIITPMGLIKRLIGAQPPSRQEPTENPKKESFLRPY